MASAQQTRQPIAVAPVARVVQAVDELARIALRGNVHPLATRANDVGSAPDSLALNRLILVLQRSPQQEQALEQLLQAQQTRNSGSLHQWLTPEQFGQQFGVATSDVQAVSGWLGSHGFQVTRVSTSQMFIEFSGTARQLREAFGTEIHQFRVGGEDYWANVSDPQIPAALAPVVAGVHSLNSFRKKPMYHLAGTFQRGPNGQVQRVGPTPELTTSCSSGSCYPVGPYDLATIYNMLPLWNAAPPIDGMGQSIAIVSRSNIAAADVSEFRQQFGLPPNVTNIILNGSDPGVVSGDETEADLDTEWSGAVAKGATIDLVVSQSTSTTDGVDLSAEYIVDNNLAPVMNESYGLCELFMGTSGNQFYKTLWQQAAAQGISVFVSSGDQGSAGCDVNRGTTPEPAVDGLQVNGIASTPYNTAVGGTDFREYASGPIYWNSTNSPTTLESAKGYIPETAWNDSCTNALFADFGYSLDSETNCNNSQLGPAVVTIGAGGGKSRCTTPASSSPSSCTGGYAKPYWQAGAGVPADGSRDVPDVSMFSSNGFQGSFYYVCEADIFGPCPQQFVGLGGTSSSAPVFAGILALVNQATGSRQGNANPVLYGMAAQQSQQQLTTCNSTNGSSLTCVFNDVTDGTIAVPCLAGSSNCVVNRSGDRYGILTGFSSSTGYDLATGLGSVNIANLVEGWSPPGATASTTTLALNGGTAVNIAHGATVNVSVTVGPNSPVPTGEIILAAAPTGGAAKSFATFQLTNGSVSATTNQLPGGTAYDVTAHYSGDVNYAPSDSAPVTATVTPEGTTTSVSLATFDPTTLQQTSANATTVAYNTPYLARGKVTGNSGNGCSSNQVPPQYPCPSGSVSFTADGVAFTSAQLDNTGAAENLAEVTGILAGGQRAPVLTTGTHTLAGNYSGDNSYSAGASAPAAVTVTPVPMAVTIESLPNHIVIGNSTGIPTSAQTATLGTVGVAPTASYTAFDNGTQAGGQSQIGFGFSHSQFTPFGVWETSTDIFYTPTGPPGTHNISVRYNGDANYQAATSNTVTMYEVYSTQISMTSSASTIQYGQSVTITATVVPAQNAGAPPTGTIQFSGPSGVIATVTLTNGQAQITTVLPGGAAGTSTVGASYSGDANYASAVGSYAQRVTPINTTTAISAANPSVSANVNAMFTATVTPSSNGPAAPSGLVGFLVNGNVINSSQLLNGQAQFTTQFAMVGTLQVSAEYFGDGSYGASTSSAITETVTPPVPDFNLSASSPVFIAAPGGTGNSTVGVMAANGFIGIVNFSCAVSASSATDPPTCSFGSPFVSLTANSTSAFSPMSISTTAASQAIRLPGRPGRTPKQSYPGPLEILAAVLVILSVWQIGERRNLHARTHGGIAMAMLLLLFALVIAIDGCGGGGKGGSSGPGNPGTAAGAYAVTVTATSGSISHSIAVTVNVQ